MKKWMVFCLVALLSVGTATSVALSAEEKAEGKPQTVCPVMGGAIDAGLYADYRGKRVYFCCEACNAIFAKDPEKYIKTMEDEGIVLEKAPEKVK